MINYDKENIYLQLARHWPTRSYLGRHCPLTDGKPAKDIRNTKSYLTMALRNKYMFVYNIYVYVCI